MRSWLKKIREGLGMSTYEAAEASGVSQSFYFAVEAGKRGNKLPVPTAKKIAAALGFEWTKFYEEEHPKAGGACDLVRPL